MSTPASHLGLAGRVARTFIDSKLTPLIVVACVFILCTGGLISWARRTLRRAPGGERVPDGAIPVGGRAIDDLARLARTPYLLGIAGFIVAGQTISPENAGNSVLACRKPDGSPDYFFGGGGRQGFDVNGIYDGITDLQVMPDGSLLASGSNRNLRTGAGDVFIARLGTTGSQNGQIDPNFGLGGWTVTDLGGEDLAVGLALPAQGGPERDGGGGRHPERDRVDGLQVQHHRLSVRHPHLFHPGRPVPALDRSVASPPGSTVRLVPPAAREPPSSRLRSPSWA